MPQCATKYFGQVDYPDSAVIHVPLGLPAFEDENQFLLIERNPTAPVVFLQSLQHPELCFLTLPILVVDPHYQLGIAEEDLEYLALETRRQPLIGSEIRCLAILVAAENGPATANLWAPIVVNLKTQRAIQAIRVDSTYSQMHPLFSPADAQGDDPCS